VNHGLFCLFVIFCFHHIIFGAGTRAGCPSHCRCEVDGSLWRVSCVDVGLSVIPSNLSGLTSYLDLSMNKVSRLPDYAFRNLHALQELRDSPQKLSHLFLARRLDANFIACLPASSFKGLTSLRHLWLDDNVLTEVPVVALAGVPTLQAVTLALNNITHIPDGAFSSLSQLVVLHLHDNQIHSLGQRFDFLTLSTASTHDAEQSHRATCFVHDPCSACTHNEGLKPEEVDEEVKNSTLDYLTKFQEHNGDKTHSMHKPCKIICVAINYCVPLVLDCSVLRVAEMPFAFQCCVFLHCVKSKSPKSWNPNAADNIRKKSHHKMNFPVSCLSPSSGPSQMCQSPFVPRFMQLSVRFIFILSVAFNFLVLVSIFLSSASKPPSQHLLGVLFWLRFLSGVSGGTMDVRDGVIMDCFGAFGPSKETEAGSRVTGFLFTLSSQACVFLTMAFVLQHKNLSFDLNLPKAWRNLQVTFAVCCTLALAVTALPLIISLFSPCVSSSHRHSPCWGYNTALVVLNALCYTFTTVTHAFLDCHRVTLKPKGLQDAATTRMTTFLLVTNTVLFLSATLLSFSSLLPLPSLPDTQVDKSTVLLIVTALPACLDPLLYMFFSLHFREDLLHFLQKKLYRLNSGKDTQHASVNSEDADKQSCQSVEIVVSGWHVTSLSNWEHVYRMIPRSCAPPVSVFYTIFRHHLRYYLLNLYYYHIAHFG
uniref:G-protein coupled receptors family 1 profile domain-containing protein n=1 Tax=Myripristis murdjan TaxID=586833 RepID=A0A667ZYB4_9TELE